MTLSDLTDRQRQVAQLVADGFTNKVIAVLLGVSDRRVRVLVSSIAFRIDAEPGKDERVEIANWWRDQQQSAA